ncbi:hypothetical protein [Parabacteroides leei]|uniref:hypothetical protein n=1 Tax=Parabacteroides leei TaxID=2939491 RepID=UPI0018993859|nr:hypothetical protein [Parabacteroides goldsteinii]
MKKSAPYWNDLEEAKGIMIVLQQTMPADINQYADMFCKDQDGVNKVINLLREISQKGTHALHIASYVLSSLQNMRHSNREIDMLLAEIDCDKPTPAYMAEVGMLVSQLDCYKVERIKTAVTYCHELFERDYLDVPLKEFINECR